MKGILTENDVRPDITYINYNTKTGLLSTRDGDIPGLEGKLLGFSEHEFKYQGEDLPKIDIFVADAEGHIYQIQLGKFTWVAHQLMNCLMSLFGKDEGPERINGTLRVVGYQKDGQNRLFVTFNGEKVKWAFSPEELKWPEDKDKREAKKNKLNAKMFQVLFEKMPFNPNVNGNVKVEEDAAVVAGKTDDTDDDDIPF